MKKFENILLSSSDDEEIQEYIDNSDKDIMGNLTINFDEFYADVTFSEYDSEIALGFGFYRQVKAVSITDEYISIYDEDKGEYNFSKTEYTVEKDIQNHIDVGGDLLNG